MKYTLKFTINKPYKDVIKKFMDADFAYEWLPSMKSMKLLKGKAGKAGSKTEMVFEENGREIAMIEDTTLVEIGTDRAQFNATYTADGMINYMENTVYEENGVTQLVAVSEFVSDKLMYKLMFIFMKFMFVKRTKEDYGRFKEKVEAL